MIAATILPYLAVFIAGLIVGRIGAYASGVKHGIEETAKVYFFHKQAIWHDVKLNAPSTDGWLLLRFKGDEPGYYLGVWYAEDWNMYDPSDDMYYGWEEIQSKGFDEWCYVNDLIEK